VANRSKESLTLGLKRPEAKAILDRLFATADVFIQNLLPGATERLGSPRRRRNLRGLRIWGCESDVQRPPSPGCFSSAPAVFHTLGSPIQKNKQQKNYGAQRIFVVLCFRVCCS
jgi:hypothetical protein